jgi:glutathione S-transferase
MPVRLHKFGEIWGIADPSPFCLKLENFLKEACIAYESVPFDPRRSFGKAPKGKVPFVEEEDGTRIGDSTLIIERLSQRRGIDLDAPVSDRDRAVSLAFRRMLDEHLYWVGVYFRWCEEPGWSVIREAFFSRLPGLVRPLIVAVQRRRIVVALRTQGTGRHKRDEIARLGIEDMQALSRLLAGETYFFGATAPTLLDLWTHAFVAEIIAPPIETPLKQAALGLTNLVDHFARMQQRLYPSLPRIG